MGSDLYTITVEKIERTKVTLKVDVIHPDVSMFDADKNIALQLVVGAYWLLKNGYTWGMGIEDDEAEQILRRSPYIRQLDDWLEMMHGRTMEVSERDYQRIKKSGKFVYKGQKLSSYGMEGDGKYVVSFHTDYHAFINLANVTILDIEATDSHLIFKVLERGMVAHLREGMVWNSRAYDFSYYAQGAR